MCNEWWMGRWAEEAEEGRRLWDEFERTGRVTEPEVPVDEPEVTRRDGTPAAPER
jgi:hypothetical protein